MILVILVILRYLSDDTCRRGEFSQWSSCSRECGGGRQWRVVGGSSMLEQACNTQPCEGEWSCWSVWSMCDGGRRSRDRGCDTEAGGSAVCSGGQSREEEDCGWSGVLSLYLYFMRSCSLYFFSGWSECSEATGLQTRHGEAGDTQSRACREEARPVAEAGASLNMVVGAAVIGFMLGSLVGAGLVYYYFKVKKHGGLHPPNYISAKNQNLYVSLPMLEQSKHKQVSSNHSDYSGTLRSNSGTMRSNKTQGSSTYRYSTVQHSTGVPCTEPVLQDGGLRDGDHQEVALQAGLQPHQQPGHPGRPGVRQFVYLRVVIVIYSELH